jgi:hypothetical protein
MKKLALIIGAAAFGFYALTSCSTSKKCLEPQKIYQDSINNLNNKKTALLHLYHAYKKNADSISYEFWMKNPKELRASIIEYDRIIKSLQKKLKK